ncbi:MAG: winged helix-turn-helix domain-containing protein [Thermoplasmatales archaeon]|nr:MAG: winged helix-turn-helix domain-containing protein [Thermoplasmatales archaeon]
MRDISTKYGESAGKIWVTLNDKGCLRQEEIIITTKINEEDFHIAVGWLARENKISRENEDCFKLDNTNLENEIGSHAGKIWKILDIWGDVDFKTIKRLSGLNDSHVNAAIGWLARENKIFVNEKNRYNLK